MPGDESCGRGKGCDLEPDETCVRATESARGPDGESASASSGRAGATCSVRLLARAKGCAHAPVDDS